MLDRAANVQQKEHGLTMRSFLQQLQAKFIQFMQGRRGTDDFSSFLVVVAIIFMVLAFITGLDVLSWLAFIVLIYSLFRCYSKNITARDRENQTYLRIIEKPKKEFSLLRKKWTNRKTTKYFKCKGCGQTLSVPRGKGTLRVVCPKCKTETKFKS